jgi:hypothetical protein
VGAVPPGPPTDFQRFSRPSTGAERAPSGVQRAAEELPAPHARWEASITTATGDPDSLRPSLCRPPGEKVFPGDASISVDSVSSRHLRDQPGRFRGARAFRAQELVGGEEWGGLGGDLLGFERWQRRPSPGSFLQRGAVRAGSRRRPCASTTSSVVRDRDSVPRPS